MIEHDQQPEDTIPWSAPGAGIDMQEDDPDDLKLLFVQYEEAHLHSKVALRSIRP